MPRAMLRDDYANHWPLTPGVRLDDDSSFAGKVSLSPYADDSVPGSLPDPGTRINPLVTVRERFAVGYDDDGNPAWNWADVISAQSSISFEEREEVSDVGNVSKTTATLLILYPYGAPAIRESATVLTDDGRRWSITGLTRFPDRLQLKVERIDDAV